MPINRSLVVNRGGNALYIYWIFLMNAKKSPRHRRYNSAIRTVKKIPAAYGSTIIIFSFAGLSLNCSSHVLIFSSMIIISLLYATSHIISPDGLLISKYRRADDAFLLHPALRPEL